MTASPNLPARRSRRGRALRRVPPRRTGFAAALLAGLAACGGGGGADAPLSQVPSPLQFLSPVPGAPECGLAIDVTVQVVGVQIDPSSLELRLNGVLLPGALVLAGNQATASVPTPGQGSHVFTVSAELQGGLPVSSGQVAFQVLSVSPPQPTLPDSDLLHHVLVGQPSASLGFAVELLPDVDGDGRAELLVGEPRALGGAPNSGRARLISGATGLELRTHGGLASGDAFGTSVAAVGDVDADGTDDYAVGACCSAGTVPLGGSATVFSGATGLVLHTFLGDEVSGNFGISIDAAGDVDDDGRADVIVGANESSAAGLLAGRVLVFSGADGSVLHDILGNQASDQLGVSVAGLGDLDGDGRDDFAAGAWGEDWNGPSSGSVRIWSGATGALLRRLDGPAPSDHMGFSIAAVGDVDGDALQDLLVGITESDLMGQDAGAARLYSGGTGALLLELTGDSACDFFGISVDGAGDVNGDGTPDLLVGSFSDVGPAGELGSATVFSGVDGTPLARVRGQPELGLFGSSVAGGQDLNGDGVPDLAVGAPDSSSLVKKAGEVRTWSGRALTLKAPLAGLLLVTGSPNEFVVDFGPSAVGQPFDVVVEGPGGSAVVASPSAGFLDADGRATLQLELAAGAPGSLFLAQPSVRVEVGGPPALAVTNALLLTLLPF